MSFDAPVVLALAPLLGGAVWFGAAWARRARVRRAGLWSQETVRAALTAGRFGPTALSISAFLGVVALAGPRWGEENIVAETRGLSLALAIDISRSMLAEDVSPNRLGRAVREARRLVQDLNGDHLGLVVFAGSSYILSPLSVDGSALGLYLDALDPGVASEGGTGLTGARGQAGAVRGLVAAYERARASESHTERGRPRAWVPVLLAVLVLVGQAASRRTAALIAIALCCAAPRSAGAQDSTRPRSAAEKAWDRGDVTRARAAYLAELTHRRQDDTAWYNAGTAALAGGDLETAQQALARAAASLEPDIRFRALYNLGLLALRVAGADTVNRDAHLAEAERAYREALLLNPRHLPAKWNLELAVRRRGGSSRNPPPSGGGGGGGAPPGQAGQAGSSTQSTPTGGLSQSQAEQILRSIGQQEVQTRRDRTGRQRRTVEPGVKDW